jgi:hypothetical protein
MICEMALGVDKGTPAAFVRRQAFDRLMRRRLAQVLCQFFHVAGFTRIPTAIHTRHSPESD